MSARRLGLILNYSMASYVEPNVGIMSLRADYASNLYERPSLDEWHSTAAARGPVSDYAGRSALASTAYDSISHQITSPTTFDAADATMTTRS